ncbi:MAG: hypothetical protein WCS01_04075 [bacterium]
MKIKPTSLVFILLALAVVCAVSLFVVLQRRQADEVRRQADYDLMKKDYEQLREQHEALQTDLAMARAQAAQASAAPVRGQGPTAAQAGSQHLKPHTPEPRLAMAGAEVKQVERGLITSLRLESLKTDPLGSLSLVVRLIGKTDAIILDLEPADPEKYSDVTLTVSDSGKLALFQGTPAEGTTVQFALSTSGPATAKVNGTCGLEPFQLEIQTSGAKVITK